MRKAWPQLLDCSMAEWNEKKSPGVHTKGWDLGPIPATCIPPVCVLGKVTSPFGVSGSQVHNNYDTPYGWASGI